MAPTSTPVVPDPPIPPAALVAAVPSGGKVAATADLVTRLREQAATRVVLRDLTPEDVVRVLGVTYCGVTGTHSPTSVCGAEMPCPIHDDDGEG